MSSRQAAGGAQDCPIDCRNHLAGGRRHHVALDRLLRGTPLPDADDDDYVDVADNVIDDVIDVVIDDRLRSVLAFT